MTAPGTYWRTLRHLKARQVVGRLIFRLGARPPAPRPAPPRRTAVGNLVVPARRSPSLFAGGRFEFLNRARVLDDGGWDPPGEEKLWRYNLHYFDDLNAEAAEERRDWHAQLLSRWIAENPPGRGTGWEPYPVSLRVVNWIKWFIWSGAAERPWIESLAEQVRWLVRRLEWHLLGNHLLANAKALCMAGLFFEGPESDRWRSSGVRILRRELNEQVLDDGGHFELSPMYHRLVLEDVQDLLAAIRCFGCPDEATSALEGQLRDVGERMWSWTEVMAYPDGGLPRFNDAADGIAPPVVELKRVARELGLQTFSLSDDPVLLLADSGYARLRWDDAVAFLDVARIGPDYLPGHAHADTLSFELEVAGRLLVVNRGTSCYGQSARRLYERGTAAHSTVEVCGKDSSEVWGGFRVGRRAIPGAVEISQRSVSCTHNGYRFLSRDTSHRRTWTILPRGLRVDDEVGPAWQAVARYHLAPGMNALRVTPREWHVIAGDQRVATVTLSPGAARIVPGEHATAFGRLVPAQTLEVELVDGRASACWNW